MSKKCSGSIKRVDTPLKSTTMVNTPPLTQTSTSNVNTRRGTTESLAGIKVSADKTAVLLKEFRAFRSEVMTRISSQEEQIKLLQITVEQTKIVIESLCSRNVEVVGSKSSDIAAFESKIEDISRVQKGTTNAVKTYAESLIKTTDISTLSTPSVVNKGGATKPPITSQVVDTGANANYNTYLNSSEIIRDEDESNLAEDENRKIVINKKEEKIRLPSNVKKGNNTNINTIKASERKKHLHVWRLQSETSTEALTDYVKSLCGSDVVVQKINHKTKRDYSSFRITVPERMYDKICQPEVWPVNTEFTEWIWFFRKAANKSTEKA